MVIQPDDPGVYAHKPAARQTTTAKAEKGKA